MMTEEMIDSLPTEDIRKFLKKKWYELEHMAGKSVLLISVDPGTFSDWAN